MVAPLPVRRTILALRGGEDCEFVSLDVIPARFAGAPARRAQAGIQWCNPGSHLHEMTMFSFI